ncbi:MAG: 3-isopropylmalate dehydratase large subunit [Candidatus Melainabacteria bacterium]|nr:3-isopropylmalate dehydratase large subunit [Candidatus Melainabacteria bacterium]
MARSVFEKIWDSHIVEELPGSNYLIFMDQIVAHEITTPQGATEIDENFGGKLYSPEKIIAINDHVSPAKDTATAIQAKVLRDWTKKHKIKIFDIGDNGICHVVASERGYVQPGITLCCGDSHTGTNGAFGSFALGIGTTAQAGAMLAQCLILNKPKTFKVQIDGKLPNFVYAKDVILAIIGKITFRGATGYVLEYAGSTVDSMSMEERMTMCNMSIEAGATSGMISPDHVTIDYLWGKENITKDKKEFDALKNKWLSSASDKDTKYDKEISLDASSLKPKVTWGTNPGEVIDIDSTIPNDADEKSLEYMGLKKGQRLLGLQMDQAFIGSCTNSRISDLREAAKILKGKKVKIPTIITPGSQAIKREAEREGLHDIFQDAGALWTHSSCGPCLGMSMGVVAPESRCISSTNRNFPGRMGTGSRPHLASPAVVAASAIAGEIIHPKDI